MKIITRSGDLINPLDVSETKLKIEDGIHGICNTAMFAGQTIKFYSYAEHSIHIHDYIVENFDELIEKFSVVRMGCGGSPIVSTQISLLDLKKSEILLYSLMHFMAYPFVFTSMQNLTTFTRTNSRILGAFLRGIGHSYKIVDSEANNPCYRKAKRLIEFVNAEAVKDVELEYNNKDAKYMYFEPCDVLEMYISRFNKVSPIKVFTLNKTAEHQNNTKHLPKIKIA